MEQSERNRVKFAHFLKSEGLKLKSKMPQKRAHFRARKTGVLSPLFRDKFSSKIARQNRFNFGASIGNSHRPRFARPRPLRPQAFLHGAAGALDELLVAELRVALHAPRERLVSRLVLRAPRHGLPLAGE